MTRPTDWWVLDLDGDPTPGEPARVQDLAGRYHSFADDVDAARRGVVSLGSDSTVLTWTGRSGDAYRQQFGDLPGELDKLGTSYRLTGDALAAYWPKLSDAQQQADRALAQGRTARANLSTANANLTSAQDWVARANQLSQQYQAAGLPNVPPPDPAQVQAAARDAVAAQQNLTRCQTAATDAQTLLDAARTLAAQAVQLRDEAARTCVKGINQASDAGIRNKAWYQKAFDWVADHWGQIIAVIKVIVAVLAIVVMIIGGPLAWVLVGLALIVFITTLVQACQGKASWWDVVFAALACIPITEGITTLSALGEAFEAGGLLGAGAHLVGAAASSLAQIAGSLRTGAALAGDLAKTGLSALGDLLTPLRAAVEDGDGLATDLRDLVTCGDPVDVVSGRLVMTQGDLALPGRLPLVLTRTHLSSYRSGRCFGPGWAGTLDQRVELDASGVVFAGEDGRLLQYPVPVRDGQPVMPHRGPRWPLTWDVDGADEGCAEGGEGGGASSGTLRITRTDSGVTLHFPLDLPSGAWPEAGPALTAPLRAITNRAADRIDIEYDEATGTLPRVLRHSGGYHVRIDHDPALGRVAGLRLMDRMGEGSGTGGGSGSGGGENAGVGGTPVVLFDYDECGVLAGVVNSSGRALVFEHDEAARITAWIDRNDYRYEYEYASDGAGDRVVRAGGADGSLAVSFAYDAAAGTTAVTDSLGAVTTYHWDEHGHIARTVDPAGTTVLAEHDAEGRLLSRTDGLGHTTRFLLNEDGDPVRVERPDGTAVELAYDALRRPIAERGPDGARWLRAYDERGNLTASTDPLGATTRFAYDEQGTLAAVTDPMGAVTRVESDAAGLATALTDALGATVRIERDAFGRVTAMTDPLGATTRTGWTVEGRLAWRTAPDGAREQWSYDPEGNLLRHLDANGGVTEFEYGPFDKQTARTDVSGARYEFGYDTELRQVSVTNPRRQTWSYVFDAAGRLCSETDFNGRTLRYRHDAAGRLTERVNGAGQRTTYERDAAGRTVERRSGDEVCRYAYDAAGRMVRAEAPGGTLEFEHDAAGRLVSEAFDDMIITYGYDAAGRRVSRTTPAGVASAWSYDALGRPTRLESADSALTFAYDAAGNEVRRTLGQCAQLSRAHDLVGRLTEQLLWSYDEPIAADATTSGAARAVDGARLTQRRTYSYRSDGYPLSVADSTRGTTAYDMDASGRITNVQAPTWTESYAYDALGNLAGAEHPGGDDTNGDRENNGTLVRRTGRTTYRHDAQGRLVKSVRRTLSGQVRQTTYTWDADDRLVSAVTPDGATWSYAYDPLGRRVAKRRLDADGRIREEVRFTWDGTRLAEQVSCAADAVHRALTWEYEPGSHRPAAQVRTSWADHAPQAAIDREFHAIVTDLAGAPTELVAPDGTVAWRQTLALWGGRLAAATAPTVAPTAMSAAPSTGMSAVTSAVTSAAEVDCPLRFPGQFHDPETGLHYNLNRYYDPVAATYLSPDPLGLAPSPDHHAYVANPTCWSDPLGLAACNPLVLGIKAYGEDLAQQLGGHTYNAREFWEIIGQTTTADGLRTIPRTKWMALVDEELRAGNPVAVALDGFNGMVSGTVGEAQAAFLDAYRIGTGSSWNATQYEMYKLGYFVRTNKLAWSNISWFYEGKEISLPDAPIWNRDPAQVKFP